MNVMSPFSHTIHGPIFDYPAFMQWTQAQVASVAPEARRAPQYFEYTALNLKRMERLNRTLQLQDHLTAAISASKPLRLWAITEAWCGDSAQSLPVLGKMADFKQVNLNIILRDDNPGIIDHYLTDGGRSIPKIVAFDAEGHELWHWGPRPQPAQTMYLADRAAELPWEERDRKLHTWYAKDKTRTAQQELTALLTAKGST